MVRGILEREMEREKEFQKQLNEVMGAFNT